MNERYTTFFINNPIHGWWNFVDLVESPYVCINIGQNTAIIARFSYIDKEEKRQ